MTAIKSSSEKIYFQLPAIQKRNKTVSFKKYDKTVVVKKYMTEKDRVQNKFLDFSSNRQ